MKTEKLMVRPLMGIEVLQSTNTEMIKVSDFLKEVNTLRVKKGLSEKNLSSYFDNLHTREYLDALALYEDIPVDELRIVKRGKYGGTYVHPLLFIDIALWVDPKLKVEVYSWLSDNLLNLRNSGGDSFKTYNTALNKSYPEEVNKNTYMNVATYIQKACGVCGTKDKWERATKEQLELRDEIHTNISVLAGVIPKLVDCVRLAVKKAKDDEL